MPPITMSWDDVVATAMGNPGTGPSCEHSGGTSGNGKPHDCHPIPEPPALALLIAALGILILIRARRSCFR